MSTDKAVLGVWQDYMEVDDSQSIKSEPNVDAYVAALQLECDEKSHNMEDSDYESDYFSD